MLNEYALEKLAELKVIEMEQYFGQGASRKKRRLSIQFSNLFKINKQQNVCCCC